MIDVFLTQISQFATVLNISEGTEARGNSSVTEAEMMMIVVIVVMVTVAEDKSVKTDDSGGS